MTPQPEPTAEPSTTRALKIAGLVAGGCLVLCGLAGTCLLIVTFLMPTGGQ